MKVSERHIVSIKRELYAKTGEGDVWSVHLTNQNLAIVITNIGCSIVSIEVPDKKGQHKNVVAGFSNLLDYKINRDYFGCIVGRYANRIAGGRFQLNGKEVQLPINNGPNHLHGGIDGFHKKLWAVHSIVEEAACAGVVFEYFSKDGEESYPGNLTVKVSYWLNNKNQLVIEYEAETDKPTPVNFTNHSYFNLSGFEQPAINDHYLQINAESYTEKNEENVPTGRILPIADTPLDFQKPKKIKEEVDQFPLDFGYDHNFVLKTDGNAELAFAAKLYEPESGRVVNVYTTQPGIQAYTANYWNGTISGPQEVPYSKHGAVALETQAFPDSPNHPSFPNTILRPGESYFSKTIYEFGVE